MEPSDNSALRRSDRPSLISAAELPRSRSIVRDNNPLLFTAAGRPRASSPNNPLPPDVTALMAQQIALLQEQTALLRAQTSERQLETRAFQSPQQILDSIDPSLRRELQKWRLGFRKDLGHWATHSELHCKYSKIIGNGDIMKQFQEESNRKWQWPKHYEAIAKPVANIDEGLDNDMQYDINAAWFSLRRKHALECQSFIAEHQKRAYAFFEERVSHQSAMRDVSDLWTEWTTQNASLLSSHVIAQAKRSCAHFVELVLREEVPKVRSRLQDAEATRAKREAAVIEAETKFEQMDPQQLIAMIELDKQAVVIKQADGTKIKEVVLCKSSELAALIRKYPDLEHFFSGSSMWILYPTSISLQPEEHQLPILANLRSPQGDAVPPCILLAHHHGLHRRSLHQSQPRGSDQHQHSLRKAEEKEKEKGEEKAKEAARARAPIKDEVEANKCDSMAAVFDGCALPSTLHRTQDEDAEATGIFQCQRLTFFRFALADLPELRCRLWLQEFGAPSFIHACHQPFQCLIMSSCT